MLGITALVIDISRLHVIKQEMQNAADAGALRGANVLGKRAKSSGHKSHRC
jgi:uncharacterized membrane protein